MHFSKNAPSRSFEERRQSCGAERVRTDDPRLAKPVLSQLSYSPETDSLESGFEGVGLGGLEPPTSRLSGVRSNHLSYRPGKEVSGSIEPTTPKRFKERIAPSKPDSKPNLQVIS